MPSLSDGDRATDKVRSMVFGNRKSERVDFARGIQVRMMGIDGTWRRDCLMIDVSQTGARLSVEGSLEGLDLTEFFLLLSSTGLAYRRCRLVRIAGDQIGVEFVMATAKPKKAVRYNRPSMSG
jgi:PilZ domain